MTEPTSSPAEIGFDLAALSAAAIIQQLERTAGFSPLLFWQKEKKLRATVVGHGGESTTEVMFLVRRRRDAGRQQVEVTVQRSG